MFSYRSPDRGTTHAIQQVRPFNRVSHIQMPAKQLDYVPALDYVSCSMLSCQNLIISVPYFRHLHHSVTISPFRHHSIAFPDRQLSAPMLYRLSYPGTIPDAGSIIPLISTHLKIPTRNTILRWVASFRITGSTLKKKSPGRNSIALRLSEATDSYRIKPINPKAEALTGTQNCKFHLSKAVFR
ncbi:hypothetical protein ANN_15958 [Periplaneta americana]|uniref:Uncharacterized protein n=1 Tax=Periplaneta americana TaxID=6978 RepID=A0ABQ8SHM2_PERAM|nr:hypothetical protein ANN_15958 [Periplaneta americana]